jgi:hypothetical protein
MGRIGVPLGAVGGLLTGEIAHAAHKQRTIPAETRLQFMLTQPVEAE